MKPPASVKGGVMMVGVVAALTAGASADPNPDPGSTADATPDKYMSGDDVHELGGGYQLYFDVQPFDIRQLRVRKAGRSAPLQVGGGAPNQYVEVVKRDATSVTLRYMPACTDVEETFTHDQLAARLDHEEGARLLRKGKHAAAATLLARAAALDPGYEPAARAHGTALVKLGRPNEAIAALSPRFAANPMGGYVGLVLDPKLASLVERPALAHLRATAPGTAKIDAATLTLASSGLARAPGKQLASIESTGSHGGCLVNTRLVIRDGATLTELTEVPLADENDYQGDGCSGDSTFSRAGQARVRSKVARANRVLAALGFSPVNGEAAVATPGQTGGHGFRFAKSSLGLVIGSDGAARWFQGGKLLIEHPPGMASASVLHTSLLIAEEHRVLLWGTDFGCEHSEHNRLLAVPAP